MITTGFLVLNSLRKVLFFEEIFLLAETSMVIVLEILFLKHSNANIPFAARQLM